jgi:hypothetical protein
LPLVVPAIFLGGIFLRGFRNSTPSAVRLNIQMVALSLARWLPT